ncbi:MAG TPA: GvpL/GvpF family gas vesicle protein [Chloroflexota bacterium]|nr:GvpL/GvpF family gas vesicle protein [Chloroflexota bacterium]
MSSLLYVYTVVPAALPDPDVPGLALVREGSVAAAVAPVPAEEFDEEPLNRRMRDLDWLAPRAERHQAVNAALMQKSAALLPLAFGTVYRDEAGLRAMLRERQAELMRRLESVRGRAEWVVTLQRDGAAARAWVEERGAALADLRREIEASSPGRAYLLARRLDDARREELLRLDQAALAELVQTAEAHAERAYREPLAAPASGYPSEGQMGYPAGAAAASAGGGSGPIARLSLLVPRAAEAALGAALGALTERWRPRGYTPDVTGPWPPYRFGGDPV